jgi:hypothetical protein
MSTVSRDRQRGQTLPIWAFGTFTVLILMAFAMAYGVTIRWQMRAQNAADAAAQGLLTAQTSQWNQTVSTLHAAAVEEYRLRYILNDLLQVTRGSGGCDNTVGASGSDSCNVMYGQLRQAYFDSLTRYTNDIALIHRIDLPTLPNQISAIQSALTLYQDSSHCDTQLGGDCAFNYSLVNPKARQDSFVHNVYSDCCAWTVGGSTSGNPKQDLAPMELEVVACANVPWPIGQVLNFHPPAFQAVGRAAATSIMATQEFMYVGSIENTANGNNVFQPAEYPETGFGGAALPSTSDENYRIDYGGNPNNPLNQGNPAISDGTFAFTYVPGDAGLEAADGFWTSMAIRPYSGAIAEGANYTCK